MREGWKGNVQDRERKVNDREEEGGVRERK